MKTLLNASIYQLTGSEKSFEVFNSLEMPEQAETEQIADLIVGKLYKVYSSQTRIAEVCGKGRFYGLAKSKPVFFELRIDGVIVFNSEELPNKYGLKCKLGDLTEEQFSFLVAELLALFLN